VWKILVSLGWSCQRPTGRALERNEEAIRHWKKVTWRTLKKSQKEQRTIVFLDESGLSQRPHRCRRGRGGATTGAAVSLQLENAFGHRRHHAVEFLLPLYPGAIRAPQVVAFLKHLLRHIPESCCWYGIVARSSQPGGARVRCRAEGRIGIEYLPAYRSRNESHRIHLGPLQAP